MQFVDASERVEQWRALTTPEGFEAAYQRACQAVIQGVEADDDPDADEGDAIDWPVRTANMEAAWEAFGADLDALRLRVPEAADLFEAMDAMNKSEELEGRAKVLQATTTRDLRRLTRELAAMLRLPVKHIRPLTQPDQAEAFLAQCRVRIAELQAS